MRKLVLLISVVLGVAGGAVAEENATPLKTGEITSATLPGTVLLHNHHYKAQGAVPKVDASSSPGMSALRVPVGASVLLEIPENTTLTLIGGPGYGRIPGGAGIEVPFGSKLVICGKGILNVFGGAAAPGGKGYGGMGGRRCLASNVKSLPDSMRKAYEVPGFKPETLPFCDKKPLAYNVTGAGGDGGDGGGGAGVAIGGRGGRGGEGGRGGPSEMIVYGPIYKSREADYWAFKEKLKIPELITYDLDSSIPQLRNGLNGFAGSPGLAGCGCGEIVVAESVMVNVTPGTAGSGGSCGPFGTTAWGYDVNSFVSDHALGLGIASTILGVAGMIPGPFNVVLGVTSAFLSIVSFIVDAAGVTDGQTMQKAAWYAGGGGGGGGGGGDAAYFGIGSGGAGGGGGGGGGSGFFGLGIGSVFKTVRLGKVDVTTQPLHVSGHGGRGGQSATGAHGHDANHQNGGEPELYDYTNEAKYASTPWNGNKGRLGAYSWRYDYSSSRKKHTDWVYGGLGANGGAAGTTSTKPVTVLCSQNSKVNTNGAGKQPNFATFTGNRTYTWTFNEWNGTAHEDTYICGSLIETASPRPGPTDWYFAGYYTDPNGGHMIFDRFGFPAPGTRVDSARTLHARWTQKAPPEGFKNVVDVQNVWGTMQSGNFTLQKDTIYWFPKVGDAPTKEWTINSSTSFGLAAPENGKTVLYIPKGVVVRVTGGNGSGATPGYPGILVSTNKSTLVVTGEGELIATGGKAGDGLKGGVGEHRYEDGINNLYSKGGDGGTGGTGAGAGIGGIGGAGGAGGTCVWSELHWYTTGANGVNGADGGAGNPPKPVRGGGCGTVCLLGRVKVTAEGGKGGAGGEVGDVCHAFSEKPGYSWYGCFGSCGGGGGGGGGNKGAAIGGGGGGGGGGGAGGAGGLLYRMSPPDDYPRGGAGAGGKSKNEGGNGKLDTPGTGTYAEAHSGTFKGGDGGVGGASGATGDEDSGQLLLGRDVIFAKEKGRTVSFVFGDECLQRKIIFKDNKGEELGQVYAQIGIALPTLPTNVTQGVRGYVMTGAYEGKGGTGTAWYGLEGYPEKTSYDALTDITLYVEFTPDIWHMADIPERAAFTYDGKNHVGFVAEENPSCRYVSGDTNAVNAGVYEYVTHLADGFTIWEDLSTDPVRTNFWNIDMAPITNHWPRVTPWNWEKTPEENGQALRNAFGFLPEGTSVEFVPVDLYLENAVWMDARVKGGANYLDCVISGAYGSDSPMDMNATSYYPWLPVLELNFTPNGVFKQEWNAFWTNYGESNLVVTAAIEGPDGAEIVPILWSNKVNEARMSGNFGKTILVDLTQLPGNPLRNYRGNLSLNLSIAGMPCRRSSAPVDLTYALDDKGCPHYNLEDSLDVLPIRCSRYLSTGDISDKTYPELSIALPSDPDRFFQPYNGTERIEDKTINWPCGQAGSFRLVHKVTNIKQVDTCYTAYFNIGEPSGGMGPDIVYVKRAGTGRTFGYDSLQAAVSDLRYGDLVLISGDVQLESPNIPSGTILAVGETGTFNPPAVTKPYHKVVTGKSEDPKAALYGYELDETKVRPAILAKDGKASAQDDKPFGPVYDASGKIVGFRMFIGNAKDELTYFVRRTASLNPWKWETVCSLKPEAGRGELISVDAPAEGNSSFYGVTVTDEPQQEFETSINGDGSLTITGAGSFVPGPFAGKLVIPAEIDGHAVTAIGDSAFKGRTDITAVDIPDSVRTIGRSAFEDCSNLASVSLPENIERIGKNAFKGTQIPELLLAEGVWTENVGVPVWRPAEFAVSNETSTATARILGLTKMPSDGRVRIPETDTNGYAVVEICDGAFDGQTKLVEVSVPAGVRAVGYSAFRDCSSLTRVIFAGDAPEAYEDAVGLDPEKCVVVVDPAADGWGATWCGCPVVFTGADGRPYRRLEYIESTTGGGQYVNTEYAPKLNTRIVARFNTLRISQSDGVFFGVSSQNTGTNGVIMRYNSGTSQSTINGRFCCNNWNDGEFGDFAEKDVSVTLQKGSITVNGVEKSLSYSGCEPYNGPIYIFCSNDGGTPFRHQATRLYSFRAYEGKKVKCDLKPCIDMTTGKAGLYDAAARRFRGNAGSGEFLAGLPQGYERIEYIGLTGKEYVDTGVAAKTGVKVEARALWTTESQDSALIGARKDDGETRFYPIWYFSGALSYGHRGWYPISEAKVPASNVVDIVSDFSTAGQATIKVGNSEYKITDLGYSFDTGLTMYLGALNYRGSGGSGMQGRIYSCKIYEMQSDTLVLVRDFVPCVEKRSGKAGLWDLIGGRFHGNAGIGDFLRPLPQGYTAVEYIESTSGGNQYINTGYTPRTSTKVECRLLDDGKDTTKKYGALFGSRAGYHWTQGMYVWLRYNTVNKPSYGRAGGERTLNEGDFPYDKITTVTCQGPTCSWVDDAGEHPNGITLTNCIAGQENGFAPMLIFAINSPSAEGGLNPTDHLGFRLYSFRIFEGYDLKRDFVPCVSATEGAGLWDCVEGKFYPNKGGAAFNTP